ncbi:MAG TPA: helix-turn-helix transcriptional regulator [Baekduia sp.]|nr:helix-turn-helix transcriptional regulator [Baekduia sp.]
MATAEPRHVVARRLLRARDTMDRCYADALDVEWLARSVHLSRAHFSRAFREAFGEPPHRYLQRRRIERAMALLRETDRAVSEISLDVGFASLGTFSRTFREVVGVPPSAYRRRSRAARDAADRARVPSCIVMRWDRPSSTFGEAAASQRDERRRHAHRHHPPPGVGLRPGRGPRLLRRQAGPRDHP